MLAFFGVYFVYCECSRHSNATKNYWGRENDTSQQCMMCMDGYCAGGMG